MKQLINLKVVFITFIVAALISCSKEENSSSQSQPTNPTTFTATAKAIPDSLAYDGTGVIKLTANMSMTVNGISGTELILPVGPFPEFANGGGFKEIRVEGTYGEAKSFSRTVSLYLWSEKTKQLALRGKVKSVLIRSCIAGTQNSPNPEWIDGSSSWPINWWGQFFPNNTGITSTGSGQWIWVDTEEKIMNFGYPHGNDNWNVDLTPNGLKRFKIENGCYIEQYFESI